MDIPVVSSAWPSERLAAHINTPRNRGRLDDPDGEACEIGSCGDSIEVFLKVVDHRIMEIRYQPHGCGYTLACASVMSELSKGKDLDEALTLDEHDVARELGGLPEDHYHCARLAVNALSQAIDQYYQRTRTGGAETPRKGD